MLPVCATFTGVFDCMLSLGNCSSLEVSKVQKQCGVNIKFPTETLFLEVELQSQPLAFTYMKQNKRPPEQGHLGMQL